MKLDVAINNDQDKDDNNHDDDDDQTAGCPRLVFCRDASSREVSGGPADSMTDGGA